MALSIAALGSDTEADFWAVHDGPACNGCYCMAWRSPSWEVWGRTPPEINRRGRCDLLAAGERDGLILYENGVAIGWCQVVRVGTVPALARTVASAARADSHAITCLLLRPDKRGAGLGSRLLALAVEHCLSVGIDSLIGVPVAAGASNEEIWTGTVGMFLRAGFVPHPDNDRVFVWPARRHDDQH